MLPQAPEGLGIDGGEHVGMLNRHGLPHSPGRLLFVIKLYDDIRDRSPATARRRDPSDRRRRTRRQGLARPVESPLGIHSKEITASQISNHPTCWSSRCGVGAFGFAGKAADALIVERSLGRPPRPASPGSSSLWLAGTRRAVSARPGHDPMAQNRAASHRPHERLSRLLPQTSLRGRECRPPVPPSPLRTTLQQVLASL